MVERSFRALIAILALLAFMDQPQAASWSLDRLMQMLASVESRQVRFTEEKHLAVLEEPLRLSGTLAYRAPDYLRKEMSSVTGEAFEVSGNTLTVKKGGKSTAIALDDQPGIAAYVESLRATFAGDRETLEKHYEVKLRGGEQAWTLTLRPRAGDINIYIRAITLQGAGQELLAIDTLEASGDRTILTVGDADGADLARRQIETGVEHGE